MLTVMKPSPKPVALIYLRVSTFRQANEGVGLETQESKCRLHAERMGLDVIEVFSDEGISGKDGIEHRPGLAKLLKKARATPNCVVVVYSISRLARRQRLLWHLLDDRDGEGLAVSSATEPFDTSTPMGRAMLGMLAVWSQLEADMVSERTKDALAEIKAQGRRLGQKPASELAPETVKLVKSLYATGRYSQRDLVDELNRRGIPTPRGLGPWGLDSVQRVLKAKLPE